MFLNHVLLQKKYHCIRKRSHFGCSHLNCGYVYFRNGKLISRGIIRKRKEFCPIRTRRNCKTLLSKSGKCHKTKCCVRSYKRGQLLKNKMSS